MSNVVNGKIIGLRNSQTSHYTITVNSGSLSSDMVGGTFTINNPYVNEPFKYTILTSSYVCNIIDILNSKTAVVSPAYTAYSVLSNIVDQVNITSSAYDIDYLHQVYSTGSGNKINSYMVITVKNLNTYSGIIRAVDLYQSPGNLFLGRYPLIANSLLARNSSFKTLTLESTRSYQEYLMVSESFYNLDWENFKNAWTVITGSDTYVTTSFDSTRLIDSLKIKNCTSGSNYVLINKKDIIFKSGTEYQLTAKVINSSSAYYTNEPEMYFYITSSNKSTKAFRPTDSYGRRITKSSVNKNTITYIKTNIAADFNGTGSLLIRPIYGDWQISNVEFKPFTSDNYSLDEMEITVPNISTRNSVVSIEVVPIGGDGNPVSNKFVTGTQLTTGRTQYQNLTGSNTVISHADNIIEGSLFVGKHLRCGVQISGDSDAMIRSAGYEGYNNSLVNDWTGFLIYSGSVLPGSGDYYRGIGLELSAGKSGSLRYRSDDSGSFLEVRGDLYIKDKNEWVNTINYILASISSSIIYIDSASASLDAKIMTDINGYVVKPGNPPGAGTGLYLQKDHMGYYSSSQWKTYMSASGEFLFKIDENNLISYSQIEGSSLIIRTGNAILSGSSVTLYTNKFFFGDSNTFISGSDNKLQIQSSGFTLSANGDAVLRGTISSSAGYIGVWNISPTELYSGYLGNTRYRLNKDGLQFDSYIPNTYAITAVRSDVSFGGENPETVSSSLIGDIGSFISENGSIKHIYGQFTYTTYSLYNYEGDSYVAFENCINDDNRNDYTLISDDSLWQVSDTGQYTPAGNIRSVYNPGATINSQQIVISASGSIKLQNSSKISTLSNSNVEFIINGSNATIGNTTFYKNAINIDSYGNPSKTDYTFTADGNVLNINKILYVNAPYLCIANNDGEGRSRVGRYNDTDVDISASLYVHGNATIVDNIIQNDIVYPYINLTYATIDSQSVAISVKPYKFNSVASSKSYAMIHTWISTTPIGHPEAVSANAVQSITLNSGHIFSPTIDTYVQTALNTVVTNGTEFKITLANTSIGPNESEIAGIWLAFEIQGLIYDVQVPMKYKFV